LTFAGKWAILKGRVKEWEVQIEGAIDVSAILRCGVYILLCKGAIVYVGKSKVMLTRVYSHRSTWGRKRTEAQPKGVVFDEVHVMPATLDAVDELERVLIARYKPRYNTQYNNGLPPDIALLVQSLIPAAPPVAQPKLHRRF
jgi:hypothetical protein